ncbi:MAG: glycosyltransferase [Halioglobus sp.]|nr:glycosyltransferase [Halioglobus sp.]
MTAVEKVEPPGSARYKSMRVLVVSDSPPERNGVGSYYADLVRQLDSRIDRSVLVCPGGKRSAWNRYLLPPLPGDSTQKIWLPNPIRLWRELRDVRPHVIVLPTPGPYGIAGLLAARIMDIPVIAAFHTHFEALAGMYWATLFGSLSKWYLSSCNRLLFRHSELVLANSREMMHQAREFGAHRVELMGTSVSSEFIERPQVPIKAHVRRVLFVGRLAEEKNLPALIEAATALPELHFTVAGEGPQRDIVEAAGTRLPNFDYIGWQPRDALVDVIDSHDLLVLPSHVESFGTVALEAMARGRLVLVSRACGITDWPELAAALFIIGDDESLAQALRRVSALPEATRRECSKNAREAAHYLNDWNLRAWTAWLDRSRSARRNTHEQ